MTRRKKIYHLEAENCDDNLQTAISLITNFSSKLSCKCVCERERQCMYERDSINVREKKRQCVCESLRDTVCVREIQCILYVCFLALVSLLTFVAKTPHSNNFE